MNTLGKRIRYFRRLRELSQDEIAQRLGYKSYTTIQKWETGINEPSISMLHKLADILGVNVNDLTIDDTPSYYEDEELVRQMQKDYENLDTRFLMDASRKLSKEGYDKVKDFIEYQLKKEGQLDD